MEKFSIEVLKHIIKSSNMKQCDIADGICDATHFSRILSGQRKMTPEIFEQVMRKLGHNPRNFVGITTAEDAQAVQIRNELKYLLRKNDATSINEAEKLLAMIERAPHFSQGVGLQRLLEHRAALAYNKGEYDDMYSHCLNGLEITRPRCKDSGEAGFDDDKIDTYSLSIEEIKLIIQFAIAHANMKPCDADETYPLEKSAKILIKLNTALENTPYHDEERANIHITMLYNLTKNLGLLNRFDEEILFCDAGINLCKKYRNGYIEPLFMLNKACSMLHLGNKKDGEPLLKKACAIFYATERHDELNIIKGYVANEFGIMVSF